MRRAVPAGAETAGGQTHTHVHISCRVLGDGKAKQGARGEPRAGGSSPEHELPFPRLLAAPDRSPRWSRDGGHRAELFQRFHWAVKR